MAAGAELFLLACVCFVFSKVQSSDVSSSVNPVRRHSQLLASSLSTKSAQEVCRPIPCDPDTTTDDLKCCQPSSKSSKMHSPVALCRVSGKRLNVFFDLLLFKCLTGRCTVKYYKKMLFLLCRTRNTNTC